VIAERFNDAAFASMAAPAGVDDPVTARRAVAA